MEDYVDFKTVKTEVSVESVASRYGVALRRTNGSHERGNCPLPSHPTGDDSKPFSINMTKQVWICHSTACAKGRRGKRGGDVIELVAIMENCSLRDAGLKLASWYGIAVSSDANRNNGVGEHTSSKEPESITKDTRYGKYDDLAVWIEERIQNGSPSRFEQAAYLTVLGQIDELLKVGGGEG